MQVIVTLPLNVRQAQNFVRILDARLKNSSKVVNESLEKSRCQMKRAYDKHVTSHNFEVGDEVMIWDPPQRKKVSRSFQPKWSGPWKITRLIGNTNCRLENENGGDKYVHLNTLKKVKARLPQYGDGETSVPHPVELQTRSEGDSLIDPNIFECEITVDDDNQYENELQPRHPIDHAYVDIDQSNILEGRLRR